MLVEGVLAEDLRNRQKQVAYERRPGAMSEAPGHFVVQLISLNRIRLEHALHAGKTVGRSLDGHVVAKTPGDDHARGVVSR